MNEVTLKTVAGILLPFAGTASGAAAVFFIKKDVSPNIKTFLLGFACGVMTAASVWSLLIPSVEMSDNMGIFRCIPAVIGFIAGMLFLVIADKFSRVADKKAGERRSGVFMLNFAVTLHNIPEGMAVGVVFAGVLTSSASSRLSLSEAILLSIGIALQNLPEGAIISMPLYCEGKSRLSGFMYGLLSGAVEPLSAALTLILTAALSPVLPYILSFAAGAMMYAVVNEIIPEIHICKRSVAGTAGITFGFLLMMVLDVCLG